LVVFSTNFDPKELADEAFLRRIANKIKVDYATPEQFLEIFRRECLARSLEGDDGVAEHTVHYITDELKLQLCQCYARDLIRQIFWSAAYQGVQPRLTRDAVKQACQNYFLTSVSS
jgi:hypothetical protein